MIYQIINFVLLAAILVFVLRKKLTSAFAAQREEIERAVADAEAQYRDVTEKFNEISARVNAFQNEALEIRESHEQALRYESNCLKEAAAETVKRLADDAEFRVRAATEKAKKSLEKELLESSLMKARENLRAHLETKDESWTERMIQSSEPVKSGKAHYAS